MSKKYTVQLAQETIDLIESRGYAVTDFIRLLLNDAVNDTTKNEGGNILKNQHKTELENFDKKIKNETKVTEDKNK